jgi:membrane protease YdiL (CAAX protease family)
MNNLPAHLPGKGLLLALLINLLGGPDPAAGQPIEQRPPFPPSVAAKPDQMASRLTAPVNLRTAPRLRIVLPLNRSRSQSRNHGKGLSARAITELGAVAATGIGHLASSAVDATKVFIPLASAAWGGYVIYRARTEPGYLADKGLGRSGWKGALRNASLAALGGLAGMASIAATSDRRITLHRDMIPLLLLYPTWGIVQQFLVQGLVAKNLSEASGWLGSPYVVTPITAAAFGAVHMPSTELAAGTFAIGMTYTPLYLKHRNVFPLGLYHGWMGVFYYFWILERNPWLYVVDR